MVVLICHPEAGTIGEENMICDDDRAIFFEEAPR